MDPEKGGAKGAELEALPAAAAARWGWRRRQALRVAHFAAPALALPLADPLLSLVDTLVVGRCAATAELAAVGCNVVVFNFVAYAANSVPTATVALAGERLRRGDGRGANRLTSHALTVAAVLGALVGAALLLGSPVLLRHVGATEALLPSAVAYCRLRAVALPAALAVAVAQAGLLARRDSRTPALVVAAAAGANVLLDILFVAVLHLGAAGAAAATALAQLAAAALMLRALARASSLRWVGWPRRTELRELFDALGPLAAVYLLKNCAYAQLQQAAVSLDVLCKAAHQAVWSLWATCSFCFVPLESSALAFLPLARSADQRRAFVGVLVAMGAAIGVGVGVLAGGAPLLAPWAFSADPELYGRMAALCLPAFLSLVLAGVDVSVMGVLLARRQWAFIARSMLLSFAVVTAYVAAWRHTAGSLAGVWWGLVAFFLVRAAQGVTRLATLPDDDHPSGDA